MDEVYLAGGCLWGVQEVAPLTNYVRSAEEHQHRLARCPEDSCHLPEALLRKYVR